ncbi:MAG TPA: transposase [candidate division Zixibacteria bacterium]|nr:transposase [candidate division Zixibacteria bacterium]
MRPKETRRRFDREFKIEAVRLVVEEGGRISEVARNLGITANMLSRWKREFLDDPEFAFPSKGRLKPHDEEMRKLRRELAAVKEEREILKKVLAIFSKEPS